MGLFSFNICCTIWFRMLGQNWSTQYDVSIMDKTSPTLDITLKEIIRLLFIICLVVYLLFWLCTFVMWRWNYEWMPVNWFTTVKCLPFVLFWCKCSIVNTWHSINLKLSRFYLSYFRHVKMESWMHDRKWLGYYLLKDKRNILGFTKKLDI